MIERSNMTRPDSGKLPEHLRISDLRGIVQLATQATAGVTRIAEGVHQSVWDTLGVPGGAAPGQSRGVTGLVFKCIQGVTSVVGRGVDTALAGLQALLETNEGSKPETPRRQALLAALNGVMGDRLVASNNPLASPMTLRCRGEVLDWRTLPSMPEATGKVLVLIHGLCMSELQWHSQHAGLAVDHGEALASALGYTPVHARYNSGLHTSENGRELSARLELLFAHWPAPIEELTVLAHSMGGLLIRSALHYAQQETMCWPKHLRNIVFLGTPHLGAPLERAGNWVDLILASTPYTAPFTRLSRLRSAGITDLRFGYLLDEDWDALEQNQRDPNQHRLVPLPKGVACYAVAATTASRRNALADRLIGDGLVPLRSALGQHDEAQRSLTFAQESQWIAYRTNHMQLLSSPEVTQQIMHWLRPTPSDERDAQDC
jgi:pimeloyl-ACP methyl ester carboxylesterase